jgi:hypothetical protein
VIGRRHDQIVEAMLDNVERLVAAGSA